MSVPTHSSDCTTRAFPYTCPYCDSEVFFFMCSCGSKVLFDSLGSPWPQHRCYEFVIRTAIDTLSTSRSHDDIHNLIQKYHVFTGIEIPPDINDIIDRTLDQRSKPRIVNRITHDPNITHIIGNLHQVNKDINLNKRFGFDASNSFMGGLLGELQTEKYSELIVRGFPDQNNRIFEYSFLISSKELPRYQLVTKHNYAFFVRTTHSNTPNWLICDIKLFEQN